jgi:hypothetical protein
MKGEIRLPKIRLGLAIATEPKNCRLTFRGALRLLLRKPLIFYPCQTIYPTCLQASNNKLNFIFPRKNIYVSTWKSSHL